MIKNEIINFITLNSQRNKQKEQKINSNIKNIPFMDFDLYSLKVEDIEKEFAKKNSSLEKKRLEALNKDNKPSKYYIEEDILKSMPNILQLNSTR